MNQKEFIAASQKRTLEHNKRIADLYSGIDPQKVSEYDREIISRHLGPQDKIAEYNNQLLEMHLVKPEENKNEGSTNE
jgi:hypothetical protein